MKNTQEGDGTTGWLYTVASAQTSFPSRLHLPTLAPGSRRSLKYTSGYASKKIFKEENPLARKWIPTAVKEFCAYSGLWEPECTKVLSPARENTDSRFLMNKTQQTVTDTPADADWHCLKVYLAIEKTGRDVISPSKKSGPTQSASTHRSSEPTNSMEVTSVWRLVTLIFAAFHAHQFPTYVHNPH